MSLPSAKKLLINGALGEPVVVYVQDSGPFQVPPRARRISKVECVQAGFDGGDGNNSAASGPGGDYVVREDIALTERTLSIIVGQSNGQHSSVSMGGAVLASTSSPTHRGGVFGQRDPQSPTASKAANGTVGPGTSDMPSYRGNAGGGAAGPFGGGGGGGGGGNSEGGNGGRSATGFAGGTQGGNGGGGGGRTGTGQPGSSAGAGDGGPDGLRAGGRGAASSGPSTRAAGGGGAPGGGGGGSINGLEQGRGAVGAVRLTFI